MKFLKENNRSAVIILTAITFLLFGNTIFNEFVYDDHYLIIENPFIKDFAHLPTILTSDVTVTSPLAKASGYYRPVSMVYLMVAYKLFGLNSILWHLNSILLHLSNTILVFVLMRKIVDQWRVAIMTALIFAVHPIHVEAVTPVYNFMGILATFFSLSAFLAFIKSEGMTKRSFGILSLFLMTLGLFSKEEVIVLPIVFVLYDFYFVHNFLFRKLFNRWKSYFLFFLVGSFYLLCRSLFVEKGAAFGLWDLSLTFNVQQASNILFHGLTIIKIYCLYILLLIFPFNLSAFHSVSAVTTIVNVEILAMAILVMGLICFAIRCRQSRPAVSFFIVLFFVSSLPISNILPIGGMFAERFIYFPSIAYCAIFSLVIMDGRGKQSVVALIVLAILLSYGLRTVERNYIWRNDVILWQDTIAKTPNRIIPRLNLADAYFKNQLYDKALVEYRTVLANSSFKEFHVRNNIGKIYGIKGEYDKALKEFQHSVAINPAFVEGQYNMGITYFNQGEIDKARLYFNKVQELDPDYPWGYYGLGLLYEKKGIVNLAVSMFEKVLNLKPNHELAQKALIRVKP